MQYGKLAPRLAFAVMTLAGSQTAVAQDQPGPWREAVVSVRDLQRSAQLFREVGGWREVARGAMSAQEIRYWRLPPSARASFLKLCKPGVAFGCIRFVRFTGVAQHVVRVGTRPWDTGGIYSIMIRTENAQAVFDRAVALGWGAESRVYTFKFGLSDLRNVVIAGPDGLNIALYERRSPPFTDYPLGLLGPAFNSMRMVRDQPAAVAFYRGALGFVSSFNADYVDPTPGPNNFSIPQNLADKIVRRAAAMAPAPSEIGRIELMQFVGFSGDDVSARATAPNLGILSVRYPVADLPAYRARVAARTALVQEGNDISVGGLGNVDLFAVRDPDGNLTEFYGEATAGADARRPDTKSQ